MHPISLLRHCEERVAPTLYGRISDARLKHIYAVNNAFSDLVKGNYARIYNSLPPNLKQITDFEIYAKMFCLFLTPTFSN